MGVLKVKVNGVWEEAVAAAPDEVLISPDDPYVLDPTSTTELWFDPIGASPPSAEEVLVSAIDPYSLNPNSLVELWFDTDATMPPTLDEEVFVGVDDPDVVAPLNTVDLWYDPDDPNVMTGVPVGGTTGQVLTKVDDVSGNTEWADDARSGVRSHHIFGAAHTWTWTLKAGTYLALFQCSCVASANGIRYANMNMDGVQVGQSKHYFNQTAVHMQMNQGVSVLTIPADGDYVFDITMSASATMDANDFGHYTIIPCLPGAVV